MSSKAPGMPADRPVMRGEASLLRHNYAVIQREALAVGVVNASAPYIPVLLVRLGATSATVGLLTALPALAAVLLALPIGRWLQHRRNVVPWYSRTRLLMHASYVVIGAAILTVPPSWAVGLVLLISAATTLPSTAVAVAFPVVMDGAAGPAGRYELLSRRWAIISIATSVTVVFAGQFLGLAAFPLNYALLFAVFSAAGVVSFWFSRQIRLPDQVDTGDSEASRGARVRELAVLVRRQSSFVAFEGRAFVVTAGIGMAAPLVPLFYVREVHAPDAWIGIIAAAQAGGLFVGYLAIRAISRLHGGHRILVPALLGTAVTPLALSLLHSLTPVAALAFASGICLAGTNLALFDELMKRVPSQHGVTFTSVDFAAQNVALVVSPIVGGLLATVLGLRGALVVAAAVGLCGFALFALSERSQGREQLPGPGSGSA